MLDFSDVVIKSVNSTRNLDIRSNIFVKQSFYHVKCIVAIKNNLQEDEAKIATCAFVDLTRNNGDKYSNVMYYYAEQDMYTCLAITIGSWGYIVLYGIVFIIRTWLFITKYSVLKCIFLVTQPIGTYQSVYTDYFKKKLRYIGDVYMRYTCYCVCLILTCI